MGMGVSVTLPCAWAGCHGVAAVFPTLGIWEFCGPGLVMLS